MGVNVENINKLIECLRAEEINIRGNKVHMEFNISDWLVRREAGDEGDVAGAVGADYVTPPQEGEEKLAWCGTAACIAGWAGILGSPDIQAQLVKGEVIDAEKLMKEAEKFLGLTSKQGNALFMPWYSYTPDGNDGYWQRAQVYNRPRCIRALELMRDKNQINRHIWRQVFKEMPWEVV